MTPVNNWHHSAQPEILVQLQSDAPDQAISEDKQATALTLHLAPRPSRQPALRLTPPNVLALQRLIGNRAVMRYLKVPSDATALPQQATFIMRVVNFSTSYEQEDKRPFHEIVNQWLAENNIKTLLKNAPEEVKPQLRELWGKIEIAMTAKANRANTVPPLLDDLAEKLTKIENSQQTNQPEIGDNKEEKEKDQEEEPVEDWTQYVQQGPSLKDRLRKVCTQDFLNKHVVGAICDRNPQDVIKNRRVDPSTVISLNDQQEFENFVKLLENLFEQRKTALKFVEGGLPVTHFEKGKLYRGRASDFELTSQSDGTNGHKINHLEGVTVKKNQELVAI